MDHHCPWTGGCVGLYNHKYFILFLFYATVGLAFVGLNICIDWLFTKQVLMQMGEDYRFYLCIAAGVASILLTLSIGFLFFTQMMTTAVNLTTLDTFTEGVLERVTICISRNLSAKALLLRISNKYLGKAVGSYPLNQCSGSKLRIITKLKIHLFEHTFQKVQILFNLNSKVFISLYIFS